ncbi:MAG: acyltransferase [Bacteroidales bacterium]|nr:acyltransferase [Bacteroidales bacterium]
MDELSELGLKKIGKNVKISRKASLYKVEDITIGDNVRIDDFCIISGNIIIGSYVHVAAYAALFGGGGIIMENFSGISSRVSIYSTSDDYLGNALTGPTIPDKYRKIRKGPVILRKHSLVGSGSVILPDTEIGIGSAVGAISLVKGKIPAWGVYSGIPARFMKKRNSANILKYEEELFKEFK